jgi:hypothetical protein
MSITATFTSQVLIVRSKRRFNNRPGSNSSSSVEHVPLPSRERTAARSGLRNRDRAARETVAILIGVDQAALGGHCRAEPPRPGVAAIVLATEHDELAVDRVVKHHVLQSLVRCCVDDTGASTCTSVSRATPPGNAGSV